MGATRAAAVDSSVGSDVDEHDASRQLRVFAATLALAVLFHLAVLGDWQVVSAHSGLALLAVWCLLRPGRMPLAALLAGEVVVFVTDSPRAVNHTVLAAIVALPVLAWLGIRLARERRLPTDGQLFAAAAPYLRLQLIGVYLLAAFAKLNDGFFDTATSCAVVMYGDVASEVPGLPTAPDGGSFAVALIAGTIAVEFALPLLLAWPRSRTVGVLVGIAFHAVLAMGGHAPFAGYALAFYTLFLPVDAVQRLDALVAARPALERGRAAARRLLGSPLALLAGCGAWLAVAATADDTGTVRDPVIADVVKPAFLLYAALAFVVVAVVTREASSTRQPHGGLRLPHPAWAFGCVLLLANAALPYIGSKTHGSFTMYSNLRTENGVWNHLVVPESVRFLDQQDDLVAIVETDDPRLQAVAADGDGLNWVTFTERVLDQPGYATRYERDGRTVTLPAGSRAELGDVPSGAARRLLSFRPVPLDDSASCHH